MPTDPPIMIEGLSVGDILTLPDGELDVLIFTGESIALKAGSAEILGQFSLSPTTLTVEIAHIGGGGEGVLRRCGLSPLDLPRLAASARWNGSSMPCTARGQISNCAAFLN